MSLSADHMQMLLDGGKGVDDFLIAAKAMERGDDYRSIAGVIETMRQTTASAEMIADVVMGLARDMLARRAPTVSRDEHSEKRDSNRSRRGLDNDRWRELRAKVIERDAFACSYCGSGEDLTCDHVVPLVRGGTNELDNLAAACRRCNSSKGSKLLSEWKGRHQ